MVVIILKNFLQFGHLLVLGLIILLGFIAFKNTGMFDKWFDKSTTAEIIKSDIDKDQDGIDDYTDILELSLIHISEPTRRS